MKQHEAYYWPSFYFGLSSRISGFRPEGVDGEDCVGFSWHMEESPAQRYVPLAATLKM